MPRVPTSDAQTYGQRRVELAPLSGAKETNAPTADVFGAGLGDVAARIGTEAATRLFTEQRNRSDQLEVLAADNQLQAWKAKRLYDPQAGALNVKGKDALGLQDQIRPEYDEVVGKLLTSLSNDRQRGMFQHAAMLTGQHLYETLLQHSDRELHQYDQEETVKGIANAQNDAVANADTPQRVNEALVKMTAIAKDHARANGLGPEATQALVSDTVTKTHVGVIDKLLADDKDRAAQVYYDETKDQINGEARARIEKALEAGTREGTALRSANEIWTALGPKGDSDPIQLDTMEDAVRAKFADDPKTMESTIRQLRERKAGVDSGRKEREDATVGTLWQAVAQGASLSQVNRLPEFKDASGRVQAQISDYIVNRAERQASRAAAEESRAYTREQRAETRRDNEGLYMYYQYAKPDVLGKMTDAQLWQLVPTIGERNVARLLEDKNKYKADPKALEDFRSELAVINGVLEQAQIDPNPERTTPEQRANVGFFREQVAAEQNRVQTITKKKVTNEELEAIAKRVLGQQVVSKGWFYDTAKPLVSATISDVPRADYAAIKQEFQGRGVTTPSDDQILQAWKLAKAQKR